MVSLFKIINILLGWGKNDNGVFGEQLTQVDLTIRKMEICNKKYEKVDQNRIKYWFPNLTTSAMFCADSNLKDDVGTCYGDSGGPSLIR